MVDVTNADEISVWVVMKINRYVDLQLIPGPSVFGSFKPYLTPPAHQPGFLPVFDDYDAAKAYAGDALIYELRASKSKLEAV